ncbi:type II secretion system protein [Thalassotalea fusca]
MIRLQANKKGFTLIELIVMILVLGIMAATVVPKFFDARGTEEVTVQNQLVSMLRNIQLRRMQQTVQEQCFDVRVTEYKISMLATEVGNGPNCDTSDASIHTTTTLTLESGGEVSFDVSGGDYTFSFDGMGRPTGACASSCVITVIGQSNRQVSINAQGFIESVGS